MSVSGDEVLPLCFEKRQLCGGCLEWKRSHGTECVEFVAAVVAARIALAAFRCSQTLSVSYQTPLWPVYSLAVCENEWTTITLTVQTDCPENFASNDDEYDSHLVRN